MSRLPGAGRPENPTQIMFILGPKIHNIDSRKAMKNIDCKNIAINLWKSYEKH